MAISCAWIIWEAIARISGTHVELRHSLWPVLVLSLPSPSTTGARGKLRAVAERTGSPALATDAFHFASDIWATLAVLVGLGASWAGSVYQRSLAALSPTQCAAIVVSLMILRITLS